jgi:hypothetical protein
MQAIHLIECDRCIFIGIIREILTYRVDIDTTHIDAPLQNGFVEVIQKPGDGFARLLAVLEVCYSVRNLLI